MYGLDVDTAPLEEYAEEVRRYYGQLAESLRQDGVTGAAGVPGRQDLRLERLDYERKRGLGSPGSK